MKSTEATKIVGAVLEEVIKTIFEEDDGLDMDRENSSDDMEKVTLPSKKKELIWTCPICLTVIKHRQNIQRHQSICTSVKVKKISKPKEKIPLIFNCEYCHATFSLQKSLKAHTKRNHLEQYCLQNESTLFKCSQCDFKTTGEKYLKTHFSKFHMQKGNFICNICDKRYATNDSLRVHKKSHLNVKRSYVCEFCGCVIVASSEHDIHNCRQESDYFSGTLFVNNSSDMSNRDCRLINNNIEISNKNIKLPNNNLGFPNNIESSNNYSENVNNHIQLSSSNNQFAQNNSQTLKEDSKSGSLGVIRSREDYLFHTQHIDWQDSHTKHQFHGQHQQSLSTVQHGGLQDYQSMTCEDSQYRIQWDCANASVSVIQLSDGQDSQTKNDKSIAMEYDSQAGSSNSYKCEQVVNIEGRDFINL